MDGLTLPAHRVRISTRARHPRITVTPTDGVVVVVPRRFGVRGAERLAHEMLSEHRIWVLRQLRRMEHLPPVEVPPLPESVHLRCVDRELPVIYRTTDAALRLRVDDGVVQVKGRVEAAEPVFDLMRRWLTHEAKAVLPPRVELLSGEAGLRYGRVGVRGQRTRWGSCSRRGDLSLNYKLLFLPSELVDYVIRHELAHTVHLNHSPHFWRLLERIAPDSERLDRAMREAGRFVPAWVEWRPPRA
ncbi:MAG: SprT family zinc-dependent metalloprotease [Chromatiales bacterium]|jgi:predicted metal-dependent hydrolase|nr:SprT family zinc-dependent metalloprotease [Chromatiales bacterium]MDX9766435.1 SprT family zinc-dependent metalloprotease [Ectothiorhodospiraceae bacterium]